ncbi:hypothetical protein HF086_005163 [Spodoptera exigua]|uniref:Uncharacterized protein n=1 Tax=Spodoptera exigua TaxID=7107 RepID=A0A922MTI9_SPOEX|nr:hypothetical protein HF086_005163 [Spodoptera exigua]
MYFRILVLGIDKIVDIRTSNYNSNDGFGRVAGEQLNFAAPSEDEAEYPPGAYLKKGKVSRATRPDVAPDHREASPGPNEQLPGGPVAAHSARVPEERPRQSREDRNHRDGHTPPEVPAGTRERFVRKARLFGKIS